MFVFGVMVVKILLMELQPSEKDFIDRILSVACIHTSNKASVNKLRTAMYNFDETDTRQVLSNLFTPDAIIHMVYNPTDSGTSVLISMQFPNGASDIT